MNNELQKLSQQWQLSNVRYFTHAVAVTSNQVMIVYSDIHQKDAVLKIGPKEIIDKELQALQYFQGYGCIKLLAFDQELSDINSALLLEYVQPGNSLKDLFLQGKEEESVEIFVDVVRKMHVRQNLSAGGHGSPKEYDVSIESLCLDRAEQRCNLLDTFQSQNARLQKLLPQAAKLADKLIATQGQQYLLHGDLHHENILKCDDAWVMIDPQAVVGELACEVGAFIRNPVFVLLEQGNVESILLYRFERLSQLLNLDKQRIIDWSFVQAVLAACYAEQDEQDAAQQYFIAVAELIAKLTHADYRLDISVAVVSKLIAEQFPQWADLPISPVAVSGWDNRTFHVGDTMSVRLPSGQEYAAQVKKEQTWLPILAKHISIQISQPIAMGKPCQDYPFYWSVYRWIDGQSANAAERDTLDLNMIAAQLAQFLHEMHYIDTQGGPVTDRGGSPIFYDEEARSTIVQLEGLIDTDIATVVWDQAIQSRWSKQPVWAHGDLSSGNILVKNRRLCAVIDFGSITIGDPACDLVIAWTFLHGESRQVFKELINLDEDAWARARGWALWKAMITVAAMQDKSSAQAQAQFAIINDILDEYRKIS